MNVRRLTGSMVVAITAVQGANVLAVTAYVVIALHESLGRSLLLALRLSISLVYPGAAVAAVVGLSAAAITRPSSRAALVLLACGGGATVGFLSTLNSPHVNSLLASLLCALSYAVVATVCVVTLNRMER
jgi:hypothetical protein